MDVILYRLLAIWSIYTRTIWSFFETYYMEEDEINSHILRILLCKSITHCGKYILLRHNRLSDYKSVYFLSIVYNSYDRLMLLSRFDYIVKMCWQ